MRVGGHQSRHITALFMSNQILTVTSDTRWNTDYTLNLGPSYEGYQGHAREPGDYSRERFGNPGDRRIPVDPLYTGATGMPAKAVVSLEHPTPAQGLMKSAGGADITAQRPPPSSMPNTDEVTKRLLDSFRTIAETMAKIAVDRVAYDIEEEKLKPYDDLASTLDKVAPPTTHTFTPSLKLAMAAREQQRERMELHYSRLMHSWEGVLGLFGTHTTDVVSAAADSAASHLRRETDAQLERIQVEAGAQLKKIMRTAQSEHEDTLSQKRKYDEERSTERGQYIVRDDWRHQPVGKRSKYEGSAR
ncbi:unnamed protein product [Peniophora sp. CBMAI 1063]|nr:unnamed protein product [Peniophora sp. CBMAI 1063]